MSAKQRKLRAAKRAHHANTRTPRVPKFVFSEIGINGHLDGGNITSMDRLFNGGFSPTPYDLIRREIFKANVRHALNDLGIPLVTLRLRAEIIGHVSTELSRSDHDDWLYVDSLNKWREWLPTQGEYVLVSETLKLPIDAETTALILDALNAKDTGRPKASAETLLGELNIYGGKVVRVKTLDYLGMLVDQSLRGDLEYVDKDLIARMRDLCKTRPFLPSLSQHRHEVADPIVGLDPRTEDGKFSIVKARDPALMAERFLIDSCGVFSTHVPDALKDVEVDKPTDAPYVGSYKTTPGGKDNA